MQAVMAEGNNLEEMICIMFKRGNGLLFLADAVVSVANIDPHTAKKLVLSSTIELRYSESRDEPS
jgi:hypothetical protein